MTLYSRQAAEARRGQVTSTGSPAAPVGQGCRPQIMLSGGSMCVLSSAEPPLWVQAAVPGSMFKACGHPWPRSLQQSRERQGSGREHSCFFPGSLWLLMREAPTLQDQLLPCSQDQLLPCSGTSSSSGEPAMPQLPGSRRLRGLFHCLSPCSQFSLFGEIPLVDVVAALATFF